MTCSIIDKVGVGRVSLDRPGDLCWVQFLGQDKPQDPVECFRSPDLDNVKCGPGVTRPTYSETTWDWEWQLLLCNNRVKCQSECHPTLYTVPPHHLCYVLIYYSVVKLSVLVNKEISSKSCDKGCPKILQRSIIVYHILMLKAVNVTLNKNIALYSSVEIK